MATHGDGASAAGGERPSTAVLSQGINLVSLALQMIGEDSEVGAHAPSGTTYSLLIDLKARIDGYEARLATARTEQERLRAAAGMADDAEDAAVTEAVTPVDEGKSPSAGTLAEDDDAQDFFGDKAARRRGCSLACSTRSSRARYS